MNGISEMVNKIPVDPNPVNTYADFGNYIVKLRIRLNGRLSR